MDSLPLHGGTFGGKSLVEVGGGWGGWGEARSDWSIATDATFIVALPGTVIAALWVKSYTSA